MEIVTEFAQSQFLMVVPVLLAVGACVLLFIYSIRPAQQPKFKLGFEDKKSAAKKKKSKEKVIICLQLKLRGLFCQKLALVAPF